MNQLRNLAQNPPGERTVLGIIIGLFLALGIAYSLVVPPFETPDEPFHYAFARHIAQGNGLPVQAAEETGPWSQEGSQAPLYYLLTGWLTAGIDQSDYETLAVRNPRANIGDPLYPGNKNFMLYSGISHPLQGANLALHIGRWFSLLLGVVTLLCIYGTARMATPPYLDPDHIPLTVTALLFGAFIPQFLFISASFSNDSMIIAAASLVVFWLARLLYRPTEEAVPWWEWVVLGSLLGIAALSKLQGLGLFGLAAAVGIAIAWQREDKWLPLRIFPLVALPALLIAGWWYWRNFTLYGDWLGVSHLLEINGRRTDPLTLGGFRHEFRGLRYSFWGLFGWFNILLPRWFYVLMDTVALLGAAAVTIVFSLSLMRRRFHLRRRADRRVRLMLLLWIVLSLLLMAYWILQATGSQGRLFMPALSAVAVLVALGLTGWLDLLSTRVVTGIWLLLAAIMVFMSVTTLTSRLPQAYRQPQPVAASPTDAQAVDVAYGEDRQIHLDALIVDGAAFQPGDDVPITLFLHSDEDIEPDYELFLQLLDDAGQQLANITTHPGWGRNPTSLWAPRVVYPDDYLLRITGGIDNRAPLLANLYVGFVNPAPEDAPLTPMLATNADGQEIVPFVARVIVEPAARPTWEEYGLAAVSARYGHTIDLVGVDSTLASGVNMAPGEVVSVRLMWQAVTAGSNDYTAFVHLRDDDGNQIAGYDQAPAGARFPTSSWRPGDRIVSEFPVQVPDGLTPGTYELWTGLYESGSGGATRLALTLADGLPRAAGEVMIGTVTVE